MFVGWARVELHIPDARSLKDKRAVIRSILDGTHARIRCAGAEVDQQELHQRAELGFSVVSATPGHAATMIQEVLRRVETAPGAEVLRSHQGVFGEDD
jgi:uncharacterized protein